MSLNPKGCQHDGWKRINDNLEPGMSPSWCGECLAWESGEGEYARGVADERARVVADLRTHRWHPGGAKGAIQPETAALRYERGEHEEEA